MRPTAPFAALLLLPWLHSQPLAAAEDLATCAAIQQNRLRLACYDQLARRAAGVAPAATAVAEADRDSDDPPRDSLTEEVLPLNLATEELMLGQRLAAESTITRLAWVITPHQRNYLLPVTWNSNPNTDAWTLQEGDSDMDDIEAKFQVSLKTLLWHEVFSPGSHLWVAYTQENWWQVYNTSSPFRETNYQPEVFLTFDNDWRIGGYTNTLLGVGFNHQSNGQGGELSRSWNRIMGSAVFERRRMSLQLRAWYRVPERASDDDNRDIDDYLGYGDVTGIWKWREHEFSLRLRNNLRSESRGAVEVEWTFPLNARFKGYIQLFNGYGESLVDYDRSMTRVGFGISMTDLM